MIYVFSFFFLSFIRFAFLFVCIVTVLTPENECPHIKGFGLMLGQNFLEARTSYKMFLVLVLVSAHFCLDTECGKLLTAVA